MPPRRSPMFHVTIFMVALMMRGSVSDVIFGAAW